MNLLIIFSIYLYQKIQKSHNFSKQKANDFYSMNTSETSIYSIRYSSCEKKQKIFGLMNKHDDQTIN